MKHWIAGTLAAALLAAAVAAGVAAQAERTASVEVRIWQSARDDLALYVSARPAGGSWRALGTIPLDVRGLSQSGRYRYGDIAIDEPLPDAPAASVEVRVWQSVRDARALYVSARPAGGSWRTLGTIPLDMRGISQSGRYRYGDIAIDVPLPDAPTPTPTAAPAATPTPTPTPTPSPSPTVCERPDDGGGLPPAVFTGVARIDGLLAERGATVTATVGDACCAIATVTANGAYTLQVSSGCGSPDDAVAFTVDGLPAAETGVWSNLTLNRLNLAASR